MGITGASFVIDVAFGPLVAAAVRPGNNSVDTGAPAFNGDSSDWVNAVCPLISTGCFRFEATAWGDGAFDKLVTDG
jgi:hypothetical protein